jgi:copper chaperone CopZ
MRLRLTIDGMLSVHAKRAVFTAMAGVPGVTGAQVEMGEAIVDGAAIDEAVLRQAVDAAGCRVTRIDPLPTALPLLGDLAE